MKMLRLANYGLQGSIGEALTPAIAIDFAAAFGTYLDGAPILVSRDTRQSSSMLHAAVLAGLMSTGCEVLDLGICPTPILQFTTMRRQEARGAVAISGGHNPIGFNGLVLIGADGAFIEPTGGETVLDILHARDFRKRPWNACGRVTATVNPAPDYFATLSAFIDVRAIRAADFTVVIDVVNGAACRTLALFADTLGFHLIPLNATESGFPAHDPEPRPRNSRQVASLIPHVGAHIGFVTSSDAGRIAIVTDSGETASEEYTLPLIANHVLARGSGTLVTNCCTTRTVDDVAARHHAAVVKTPVGQAHVLSALADENGVIGGEGNGSVAIPAFSRAFDGFLMMALILEAMAHRHLAASALLGELPAYHMVKRKIYAEPHRCYRALEGFENHQDLIDGGRVSTTDGLRVDWQDGWMHLRASQTEPMIRVISESASPRDAENRAINASRLLEEVL